MIENRKAQPNDGAPGTTVLSAIAAGIFTTLTAAYGFGLWGGPLFPLSPELPYTDTLEEAARWRFVAASATFGLLAVLPSLALLYVTSWTKERLARELSYTKATAAAYERANARLLQENGPARIRAAAEDATKI